MAPRKVTFDTNMLEGVVKPDSCMGAPDHAAYVAVHEALRSGQIRGYFSEAVVALDALRRKDKVEGVGGARVVSQSHAAGPSAITIAIGARWPRPPVDQRFLDCIQTALALGMRALIGPRPMVGSLVVHGFGEDFYEPFASACELVERGGNTNEVDAALVQRGLGRAHAFRLGRKYSERDGANGEWWQQGLERARDSTERKKVQEAINEWADGEAIAAHIGYSNDLFCTGDFARGAGTRSALHPTNRAWLKATYGIEFVTISELGAGLVP